MLKLSETVARILRSDIIQNKSLRDQNGHKTAPFFWKNENFKIDKKMK